jgi:hypothetical protein
MAKKEVPEFVRNVAASANAKPAILDLKGAGPFQLPALTNHVSVLSNDQGCEVRLQTTRGQDVRLRLDLQGEQTLSMLLKGVVARRREKST